MITVRLELVDGDQVLLTATVGPIKATDNGGQEDGSTSVMVTTEMLSRQPPPALRLTVNARDY